MNAPLPLAGVSGMAWPPISGPATASMLALQWQLERSQWLDAQTHRAAQLRQLAEILVHAANQVPWYQDCAHRADLAAGVSWESFASWPVLRAADARAHASELCAKAYPEAHGRLVQTQTSGSTGRPFRVFQTEASQFFSHGLVIRDHLLHGRDFSAKLGKTVGVLEAGGQPAWGLASGVFATGPAVTMGTSAGVDAQLEWLIAEAPAYLIAHTGNLRAMLLRSRETGRAPRGVRQLIAHGGMLPPDLPSLAASLWQAEVVDTYSCEEFGLLAFQCPGHEHYHVNAEHVLVELVRDDGKPCAPGETGRVIVTALNNFAMPLVRYEQGDYAVAGGPCAAGRGLPTLEKIVGRSRNMLRTPDGKQVFPAISADMCLNIAPIRQFRLVQTTLDTIELHYSMERELGAFERSALAAAFGGRFGYPFRFAFVRVDRFEEGPGGKFEDFVSRLELAA